PHLFIPSFPARRSSDLVIIVTIMALWILFPSWRFYSMSPAERQHLAPQELSKLRRQAVHLGLDLQGGMHLVLPLRGRHRVEAPRSEEHTSELQSRGHLV